MKSQSRIRQTYWGMEQTIWLQIYKKNHWSIHDQIFHSISHGESFRLEKYAWSKCIFYFLQVFPITLFRRQDTLLCNRSHYNFSVSFEYCDMFWWQIFLTPLDFCAWCWHLWSGLWNSRQRQIKAVEYPQNEFKSKSP